MVCVTWADAMGWREPTCPGGDHGQEDHGPVIVRRPEFGVCWSRGVVAATPDVPLCPNLRVPDQCGPVSTRPGLRNLFCMTRTVGDQTGFDGVVNDTSQLTWASSRTQRRCRTWRLPQGRLEDT